MERADSDGAVSAPSINVLRKAGHPVGQSDILTPDEIRKILSLPDKRKKDELRDYAVLLVFCNTPIRKGEMVKLNVSNLIRRGKSCFIHYAVLKKRKTEKREVWIEVPIPVDVYDVVIRYVQSEYKNRKIPSDAPLFFTLGKHGPHEKRRITPRAIEKIVAKYKRKAGINKRLTAHSFRATYVTDRKHIPPGTMIQITGHKDIKGLSPYLRSSKQEVAEAALSRQYI